MAESEWNEWLMIPRIALYLLNPWATQAHSCMHWDVCAWSDPHPSSLPPKLKQASGHGHAVPRQTENPEGGGM